MFIKTYNYLKLKALPSSILNKCRILLERNSKHRRITSQFGSTFRNSKWTDYTLNNINPLSDTLNFNPFIKLLNLIFLITIFTIFIYFYYPLINININSTFNSIPSNLIFLINFFYDWYFLTISLIINFSYYFIFNYSLFPLNINFQKKLYNEKNVNFNKLYNNSLLFEVRFLENTKFNYSFERSFYNIFLQNPFLLKPSFYNKQNLNLTNPLLLTNSSTQITQNNNFFLPKFSQNLNNSLNSNFYVNNLNFQNLNYLLNQPELFMVNLSLNNQISLFNTLRWSYRYSTIHRRTMYNSHKITEVKKLLNNGFFHSDLSDSNLWFSHKFARNLTSNKSDRKSIETTLLLKSNWNLLYNTSLFKNNNFNFFYQNTLINTKDNLLKLSFFESSFHFFLKRMTNYNLLVNNQISTTLNPNFNLLTNTKYTNIKFLYKTTLNFKLNLSNLNINNSNINFNNFKINKHFKDILLIGKLKNQLNKTNSSLIYNLTRLTNSKKIKITSFSKKFFNINNAKSVNFKKISIK